MPEPKSGLRFPKRMHLRKRGQFDSVFQSGTRLGSRYLAAWVAANDEGHPRVGFAVSAKVGCIALRNRVRRVMREAFRLHQHELQAGVDIVFVPARAWADYRLAAAGPHMASLLQRIEDRFAGEVDRH